VIGQAITPRLGQPWIVDNRGGAGGAIAIEAAAKAPADGYTLLVYAGNVWTIPLLRKNVRYEVKGLAPVTWAARSPGTLVVHPSLPVRNVRDLIALAKARPGQLSYGSGGVGASTHLAAELFKSMAKVDILWVPYKGNGPAMNDLIAGQVPVAFLGVAPALPLLRSGKIKALGIASASRSELLPDVPTLVESGYPQFEAQIWFGFFTPSGVPPEIVTRLTQSVKKALSDPEIVKKLAEVGVEVIGGSPAELGNYLKSETAKWGALVKSTGAKPE